LVKKAIEKKEDSDILLSEEDVNFAITYANAISGAGFYGNAITPMLLNERLRSLNLNPLQATEDKLNAALQRPQDHELELQSFGQDFENQSQVYKKLLEYLGTFLSFDLTYDCINAKYSDYTSKSYQKDLDIVKDFIYRLDYRTAFTSAVQEMLRSEAYFCSTRFEKDKIVLQELPSSPQYTLIDGKFSHGLLYSFNMYYFIQVGVDINLFSDFFKQKFLELWQSGKMKDYNSHIPPELRGDSAWVYWQQIPPEEGFCFKFNANLGARIPGMSGLFLDLLQQPMMRSLQKNINLAVATKTVMGEIGMLNKTTQASVKDSFSISAKNLGEFLAVVKSAIGDAVKVASAPLQNIQGISFSRDDVYNPYLKTTLASSGVNTNLIFTSDVRPNIMESQLSLNVDENTMTNLYPQFENFMNYWINKQTKNFKFNIKFQGTKFFNNRQQRFEKQTTLLNSGIVLPQQLAASLGMNVFEFQHELDEARANKFVDNLTPIISAFQQSSKDTNGRPQKSDSQLSDSGEQTRSQGNNIEKGGSV
jgi:hypothetical protein